MIRSLFVSVFGLVHLASIAQSDRAVEKELIARSNELMNAVERQDRTALDGMLTDEFKLESPGDTASVPRAEWIDNAVGMKWSGFTFHNLAFRVFGDVAVVSSLLDFKVTMGIGIPISSNVQVTDVWVHREGVWLLDVRQLGADSLSGKVRMVMGFVTALVLWFVVRMVVRFRRKAKARKALTAVS